MNKLMNSVSHHPGLWTQKSTEMSQEWQQTDVSSIASQSLGKKELKQLAPQLAQLSQQGRWIVLISPPNIGYKQLLAQAGVRMDRVLLVHAKDEVETLWAMEKALTSGTSSAVIGWTQCLDSKDQRRLKIVAKSARALGIVFENANAHLLDSSVNKGTEQHNLFTPLH